MAAEVAAVAAGLVAAFEACTKGWHRCGRRRRQQLLQRLERATARAQVVLAARGAAEVVVAEAGLVAASEVCMTGRRRPRGRRQQALCYLAAASLRWGHVASVPLLAACLGPRLA